MGRMCGKEKKKRKKEKIIKGEDTLKTGFLGHLPGRIELSVVVVVCWYGFFFFFYHDCFAALLVGPRLGSESNGICLLVFFLLL